MSEREDEILAANIERLVHSAQARPTPSAAARERMLERLRADQRALSQREAGREAGRSADLSDASTAEDPKADAPAAARTPAHSPAPTTGARSFARAAKPGRLRKLTPVLALTGLAAALLLAWVLGVGNGLLDHPTSEGGVAEYVHDGRGAREITLADGSRAVLRAGSQLRELAPSHLELVSGEVVIEAVAASEPLLIETATGQAVVTGARLWLRNEAAENTPAGTTAAVLSGRATLRAAGSSPDELLLHAGERGRIDTAGAVQRVLGRRLTYELDWARELLAPAETPEPMRRGNLLARVPRWTGQLEPSPEWPLGVRRMTVDVHVEDGHVRTTIDQTFFNHVDAALEGVYRFPLPADAAISRLAMYVDGERMEAGVVERGRGRDIYEQIVHRRRDPALLEWMRGNMFQIRIFPLPARTEKRVLLSYTQDLDELYGRGELRVPIPEFDLPVGELHYRVRVVGGAGSRFEPQHHDFELHERGGDLIAEFTAQNHSVGADIVAQLHAAASSDADDRGEAVSLLQHRDADGGRHLALRLRPDLSALVPEATDAPARDLVVLLDTSASRGQAELDAQRRFLLALVELLDDDDRLAIQAFDSRVRWSTPALEALPELDRQALAQFLREETRAGLGITDLGVALDAALERLSASPEPSPARQRRGRVPMIVYLGDGIDNDLRGAKTSAASSLTARMAAASEVRFAAVSFGAGHDDAMLESLAAAGAGLHLHVDEGDALAWRALELLTTLATPRVLELEARLLDAEGQEIASERTHAGARALAEGERLELLTRLAPGEPSPAAVELRGRAANTYVGEAQAWSQRYELPAAPERDSRWIPRAWARAHVAALSEDEEAITANAAEITRLGLEHFLVTPTTSLLVLENERMYREHDLHRPPSDAWARYDAPQTIEVVREGSGASAGRGQYVVRTPAPVLNDYGWGMGWNGEPWVNLQGGSGELGLVGFGRGGGGLATGSGFGRDLLAPIEDKESSENKNTWTASDTKFAGTPLAANAGWGEQQRLGGQLSGKGQALLPTALTASDRFGSGLGFGARGRSRAESRSFGSSARPWPQAMHYTNDPRLDDLGELAPALFQDEFDLARDALLLARLAASDAGEANTPAPVVPAEVRARIDAARAAQGDARYALPEGGELHIDGEGRFAIVRERWGFLDERVIYDGETLRADYPELGLSVDREVGETSPALLDRWVPWMMPAADHLAAFYTLSLGDPRTLILHPRGQSGSEGEASQSLRIELDERDRVVAIRRFEDEHERSATTFGWDAEGGLTISREGETTELERLGPAQPGGADALLKLGRPQDTRVELPLASPAELESELDGLAASDPRWLALEHQRLAGYAALGDHRGVLEVLETLREQTGRVLPGELVLAGAALSSADAGRRAALLAAAPEGDAIAAYLEASQQLRRRSPAAMRKLARDEDLAATPVHFMAGYRGLIYASERQADAAALTELEAWLARYSHPELGYIATTQLTNRWWSKRERKVAAWLALADQRGPWTQIALNEAALCAYQWGQNEQATEIFERALDEAERDGELPVIGWHLRYALVATKGEAGWQLTWTKLRERVTKSGDPELILAMLAATTAMGMNDEAQRILDHLDPKSLPPELALHTFDALLSQGHVAEAQDMLEGVAARLPEDPEVRLRVYVLAERQGRLADATVALDGALTTLLEDGALSLAQLRWGFATLFELHARQARSMANDADSRSAALRAALAVGDRWRAEDPDYAEIDRLCAELSWAVDHDDEAWRYLGSSLDRHPADGPTMAWVADVLERNGELERADSVWTRAIAVEPTDPMHRLRRAQNLLATDHEDHARALLREIVDGDWQPRFAWVVSEAKRLQKQHPAE
ncbi:VWA domain-containing protein [Pseudenhygromyxa sp. WMMC2535]|uniref:VIT domain-containing protein n=1 Tax=Pseudenhygromyxa sp. WMMC2535 TaxID=2712867 RepID=UPI0015546A61|nr:VIT domain-containing protein [Pseudenhygromyxa sp. WMMC2535]NVB41201.1 VWA domain-containing protein [Pseudenhygromyxa sp. WMMC2535]